MTDHPSPITNHRSSPRLSKSKFLSGLQCSKRLYFEVHSPELATEPDDQTRAILDMGTSIGELARQRYPGGVLVEADHRRIAEALKRTAELIQDPNVPAIFEGAFEFDQVLIRVDILERVQADGERECAWRLIEVKASTRVKDVHLADLAVQAYVLRGAGLSVFAPCLMHINTQYVYPGGEVDLGKLFAIRDLSQEIASKQDDLPHRVVQMKDVLRLPTHPSVEPGEHCHTPFDCAFWDHCTRDKSPRWVYHLPGGGRVVRQLVSRGIETIDDIPERFPLNPVQRRMRDNVEWVSPRLKAVLQTVRYPVHHLDFETFMPPIPRFPMTRPYEAIPTQWSDHIETMGGELGHKEYICTEAKDPREELVVALLDALGEEGSICVYSGYERAILERLSEGLPQFKEALAHVIGRLWDLFSVIREHYYHPDFNGSFSIKSVLPALAPDLDYVDLEIKEGGMAARLFEKMVYQETDWVERARLQEALLKYCQRDTLAMVEIRKVLLRKTVDGASSGT